MERLLFRLSVSPHADKFILKGALMMKVWRASTSRSTRDIDLLGHLPNEIESLVDIFREISRQEVQPDALLFDANSTTGIVIRRDAEYEGVRITFRGSLQNIQIPMQIDIGFGDVVFPEATLSEYPVLLDHTAPRLRGYPRETTIAEKFESLVKFGLFNSRMKDFFDLWNLSQQFGFEGATLAEAIRRTFSNRGTMVTDDPSALRIEFASDAEKIAQWKAFTRRLRVDDSTPDLAEICKTISNFLKPPAAAILSRRNFHDTWPRGGPWLSSSSSS